MSELWFPAERVVEAIGNSAKLSAHPHLTRRFYEIREGRQRYVSLRVVDDILTRLGLTYLLQIPREEGGLADIYVDGKQYGQPDRTGLRNTGRRYETDDERREALRRNWRESKRRARDRAL